MPEPIQLESSLDRRVGAIAATLALGLLTFLCPWQCVFGDTDPSQPALEKQQPASDFNKNLGAGINLGNALEAPREGDWGVTVQPQYFKVIKEAGFSHVRIPIRWSAHADKDPPYNIDSEFLQRVDWAVDQALSNSLAVVINMHHYEEMEESSEPQKERFLAMWRQIAEHFKTRPAQVAFEIYNEPCKSLDATKWNALMRQTLAQIRTTNPHRIVVVGPIGWNNLHQLKTLELPDSDRDLLVTIHYYEPFHFTHQGASWVGKESDEWLGTKWSASQAEQEAIAKDFDETAQWGKENDRPVYLGEFGSFSKADMDSRALWTDAVQTQARVRGFSTAYWEFCSGFGAYDAAKEQWRAPLLNALRNAQVSR